VVDAVVHIEPGQGAPVRNRFHTCALADGLACVHNVHIDVLEGSTIVMSTSRSIVAVTRNVDQIVTEFELRARAEIPVCWRL
jgi:hypothetical protein